MKPSTAVLLPNPHLLVTIFWGWEMIFGCKQKLKLIIEVFRIIRQCLYDYSVRTLAAWDLHHANTIMKLAAMSDIIDVNELRLKPYRVTLKLL